MEVIINADDYGISEEVNDAIIYCFKNKLIQSTSLMVNMPYVDEAVKLSKENGFDHLVGLHINLVEGYPLTEGIKHSSFCDNNGRFNGSIMSGIKRLRLSRYNNKIVEDEIVAQIKKFRSYGYTCHHVDSHRHSHTNRPVLSVILKYMKLLNNCPIRLSRNMPQNARKGLKGLYKKIINKRIMNYNNSVTDDGIYFFGGIQDYLIHEKEKNVQNKKVEIMIHPIMHNKKLTDAMNQSSIEEWLNERD